MITAKTPLPKFISLIERTPKCDEHKDKSVEWLRFLPEKMTTLQMLFVMLGENERYKFHTWEFEYIWALWAFTTLSRAMDRQIRLVFVDFIARDPRQAAELYISHDDLTVEERNLLLHRFHSNVTKTDPILPEIEDELRKKKVIPAFRKQER